MFEDYGTGTGSLKAGSAALDTWLATTSDREWQIEDTADAGSALSVIGKIRWRDDVTFQILGEAEITLRAWRVV